MKAKRRTIVLTRPTCVCPACGKTSLELVRVTPETSQWECMSCNHVVKEDV